MRRISTASNSEIIGTGKSYHIVIVGAGNVASHIARHFHFAGHTITCVYSRTEESAASLAGQFGCPGTNNPDAVPSAADFYVLAVTDSAVPGVAEKFSGYRGIFLHTAGALPAEILSGHHQRYGVLYPLQTLSLERSVNLKDTPMLIEGSDTKVLSYVKLLAGAVSDRVYQYNSRERLVIHLAAVFANNFSNHMVHIGQNLLDEYQIDPQLLDSILSETVAKISDLGASRSQTGPAVRGDSETMKKHAEILRKYPEWEKLYTFISLDIQKLSKP